MKFMTMVTTTNAAEAGPPPPSLMQAIVELGQEAGARLVESGGMGIAGTVAVKRGHMITDGPFAEAKEVIAGYALYDLESEADAVAWTERFVELHRLHWPAWEGEVIIRRMYRY